MHIDMKHSKLAINDKDAMALRTKINQILIIDKEGYVLLSSEDNLKQRTIKLCFKMHNQ